MFTAVRYNGEVFSLLQKERMNQKEQITQLPYYCPVCQREVVLKKGKIKTPHFAHKRYQACSIYVEPESETHLNGKVALFQWLNKQLLQPVLEHYFKDIKQRADIYISSALGNIAFEFQCSPISVTEIRKRTLGYKKIQVKAGWILGNYPRGVQLSLQSKKQQIRLSVFHWSLLQFHPSIGLYLILFNPGQQLFTFIFDFEYVSSAHTIATVQHLSLNSLTYPFHFKKKRVNTRKIYDIVQHRNRWIERKRYHDRSFKDVFLLTVYQDRLNLSQLTPYIGLPVPFAVICHTHYIEWQYYVWRDVLIHQTTVTIHACSKAFWKRVESGHIQIKECPLISKELLSSMIVQYLDLLTELKLMTKLLTKEHTYRINQCLSITNSQDKNVKIEQSMFQILK